MNVCDFHQVFFDEADELLAEMEKLLLTLDPVLPDKESLNAIFRAAHSIKGGAGTFGFSVLQETTHILENLLDEARSGEIQLNTSIINLFLESKDIMQEQLESYKSAQEPNPEAFRYICEALRQIALENKPSELPVPLTDAGATPDGNAPGPAQAGDFLSVVLCGLKESDIGLLTEELANLGDVSGLETQTDSLRLTLQTTVSVDDILAVLCFVLEPEQISITPGGLDMAGQTLSPGEVEPAATSKAPAVAVSGPGQRTGDIAHPTPPVRSKNVRRQAAMQGAGHGKDVGTVRVAVEKVDQIINLVGELIITQAMLSQSQLSGSSETVNNDALLSGITQLERNARDLQESVMSIRMMPMEYVFSRFPRLVHDLADKLNKKVELTLWGGSAELDKSLIERIVDPLTHLVRNSLDHGIESVDVRRASGKPDKGNLTLSAEHHGGNIVIEVVDDGAGLNREKILAKAQMQEIPVSDNMSDEEVWMLIFTAGFSTADKVTDVSGRGVGMDVVKRNIQDMGGYVAVYSEPGRGTTVRIVLPLTLAILDGMSVRVGSEVYVLPLGTVMESLMLSEVSFYRMAGGELMLQVRGEYLPLIELHQIFDIDNGSADIRQGIAVIVQSGGSRYALLVDQLIGQHQVVVKNLEQNYRKIPGISAATILGDGSVALILDVAELTSLAKNKQNKQLAAEVGWR